MLFQQLISPLPFKQWLLQDKENKRLLWFSLAILTIAFTWIKILYPYPNFMPPDSYSYLKAAQDNKFINMWPIGYSKFLRLVSSFSQSHMVLVTLQYILLQASVLYCLFTVRYLLSPGKWVFRILLTLSVANPLLPHIANYVSSDCLFAALSLVWFTQLLWIIYQPTRNLLYAHAVILLLAFTVRFTALYYPFFSVAIILFKSMPKRTKWLGIGAIALLLLAFIGYTQNEYRVKTGTIQYSAFGGWQMAANALYGYAYAKPDDPATVPAYFRELHTIVNHHMDSLRKLKYRPDDEVAIYYLWDYNSPLRVYLHKKFESDKDKEYFKRYAMLAPFYNEYGRYLILHHPIPFLRYYAWPNLLKYYAPPAKFMGMYNLGWKKADSVTGTWFGWKSLKLPIRTNDPHIHIADAFTTLSAIINPLFLFVCLVFIAMGGWKNCPALSKRILATMFLIWLGNAFFSVLSAPIELRYQIFPISITLLFCGLFIEWIVTALKESPTTQLQQLPLPEPVIP